MSCPASTCLRIGTAGWTIPTAVSSFFERDGSALERYSSRFLAAEINSTFHRSHRKSTYERWWASVPDEFRFSVKAPREITHERRLIEVREAFLRFHEEVSALGTKLGPILIQLPPSLEFSDEAASALAKLTDLCARLVLEPRHPTWFTDVADRLLTTCRIARVAADPARVAGAGVHGGWPGFRYTRLHGSPRIYYSSYEEEWLKRLASSVQSSAEHWCIFDNTASGAACRNALTLLDYTIGGATA
jgi:uncharacterized protein YecE (DUF72 family)